MGQSRIINRLPEHLKEVYGLLTSMRYSREHLKYLEPLEVRFIRDRCRELHIHHGFDELIEYLNLGFYFNSKGGKEKYDNNRQLERDKKAM